MEKRGQETVPMSHWSKSSISPQGLHKMTSMQACWKATMYCSIFVSQILYWLLTVVMVLQYLYKSAKHWDSFLSHCRTLAQRYHKHFLSSYSKGNKKDESELPIAMVSLTATVIHCMLNEWKHGHCGEDLKFNPDTYASIYKWHYKSSMIFVSRQASFITECMTFIRLSLLPMVPLRAILALSSLILVPWRRRMSRSKSSRAP
ncbi:hypothetical protein HGRIS_001239 [Hohenbuehelia grisea]|uniref:DUF6532 domain-containing protein n=1 Tax=Hohenbuehelia grisea TaxID=104357 RepID=A0ABR3JPR4_9AGAR